MPNRQQSIEVNRSIYDHYDSVRYAYKSKLGLTKEIVEEISSQKNEPEWMLQKRLKAFEIFQKMPMPNWGPSLKDLDLNNITYFQKADAKKNAKSWEDVPEEIKRTFEKLGIPEAERKALAGAGTQYECITEDSLIMTNPKGEIKVKDIQVGDCIFSLNEKTNVLEKARVLGKKCSGEKEVFEVNLGKRSIKASSNHPFLVLRYQRERGKRNGFYKKEWIPVQELRKNDLIAIVKDYPDSGKSYKLPKVEINMVVMGRNQFKKYKLDVSKSYNKVVLPSYTSEDLMWFLGLYLGDGWIHRTNTKAVVEIATPKEQSQLRNEINSVVSNLFGENIMTFAKDRVRIYSTIVANFIEKIGFHGKAKTKEIPDWIFSIPKSERLAFLGGYLDSDGYVRDHPTNHDIAYTSVNKGILEKISTICNSVGLETSKVHQFKSKNPFKSKTIHKFIYAYRLQVSGDISNVKSRYDFKKNRLSLQKYFHRNVTARGMPKFEKFCNEYIGFRKIRDILNRGIQSVWDIEVEKNHNFVANGIVVHNSEVVYHNLKKEWEDKGVIFSDCDVAVQEHPDLVKKYFMTSCVPVTLHKFAALHAAVWSGGTFIYVPPKVKVGMPLQAYFRMNAMKGGQFEHTLIIVDRGADVQYIEGCSSPQYTSNSLHAGCVEIHVLEGARARYSSIENWSKNTYNLNTKRAIVQKNGIIEWVNGNNGSRVTMLYPTSVLVGENSKSDFIGIAFAGKGQNQDTGTKVYHLAPNTTSTVQSKSISKDGGITSYRGLLHIKKGAINCKSHVRCDALMVDNISKSNTFPYMDVREKEVELGHEATVGKISDEQVFYLMSRGLKEETARQMIVSGFIEPVVKALPLEYAVELNRLIELEMEGSLG